MADKLDFKKEYKDLYLPGKKAMEITVPAIPFLMVDGKGEPGGDVYQHAMSLLYSITFTIKMSKMGPTQPEGYVDYVLPPLEGLWDVDPMQTDIPRSEWTWTSLIRLPDYVTPAVFEWAKEQAARKNPQLDYAAIRREVWQEGLCVQMMHIGPYNTEPDTITQLHAFMREKGLQNDIGEARRHHEIYLGDPRKTAPEKRRTVLRLPVRRAQ